jgi:hypothetical protein
MCSATGCTNAVIDMRCPRIGIVEAKSFFISAAGSTAFVVTEAGVTSTVIETVIETGDIQKHDGGSQLQRKTCSKVGVVDVAGN